jgi:hypothetical protein
MSMHTDSYSIMRESTGGTIYTHYIGAYNTLPETIFYKYGDIWWWHSEFILPECLTENSAVSVSDVSVDRMFVKAPCEMNSFLERLNDWLSIPARHRYSYCKSPLDASLKLSLIINLTPLRPVGRKD